MEISSRSQCFGAFIPIFHRLFTVAVSTTEGLDYRGYDSRGSCLLGCGEQTGKKGCSHRENCCEGNYCKEHHAKNQGRSVPKRPVMPLMTTSAQLQSLLPSSSMTSAQNAPSTWAPPIYQQYMRRHFVSWFWLYRVLDVHKRSHSWPVRHFPWQPGGDISYTEPKNPDVMCSMFQ